MPESTSKNTEHKPFRSRFYSSRIIKATALLGDTKMLLAHLNPSDSVNENLERIQRENLFGKTSRSRVQDILNIFRQRYLQEGSVIGALVKLAQNKMVSEALDKILYFHSARADSLLFDVVTVLLYSWHQKGLVDVDLMHFQNTLADLVKGRLTRPWSEITLLRVAQNLLATLRDFGVLQGVHHKKLAPTYLSIEAFSYIVFYLKQHQPSGAKLVELPDWKLFFLSREGVERFLFEAHQRDLLEYHVAGSVTRLTFPANTIEEYANVLTQR